MTRSTDSAEEDVVAVDRSDPEEVFAALADELRLEILQAMMAHPESSVSFSDLREAVGVSDPGRFHYHLDRLVGRFVRKDTDGYELTHAGRVIVGAIYAGTYTADAEIEQLAVDASCITCGGDLYLDYTDEAARIRCSDCTRRSDGYPFPPRGLDQFSREELPRAIGRWVYVYAQRMQAGFCPICTGRIESALVAKSVERHADFPAHVEYRCPRCGERHQTPGITPIHTHPSFRHFLTQHGFPSDAPVWEIYDRLERPTVELIDREPPMIEARYSYDGTELIARVDHTAAVETIDWTDAPAE